MKMTGKYFLMTFAIATLTTYSCKETAPKTDDDIELMDDIVENEDKVLSQEVYKEQLADSKSMEVYELSEVDQLPLFDSSCLTAAEPENCSDEKLNSFLEQYLQMDRIEGVARYVEFVVSEVGEVQNVQYVSNASEVCQTCKETAEKVIGEMQRWEPAVKEGAPVSTKMRIEI